MRDDDEASFRSKYYTTKRFKKATVHATLLAGCAARCADAMTSYQAQAYRSLVGGDFDLDKGEWTNGFENFCRGKEILEQLLQTEKTERKQEIYKTMIGETETKIRFCEYNYKAENQKVLARNTASSIKVTLTDVCSFKKKKVIPFREKNYYIRCTFCSLHLRFT